MAGRHLAVLTVLATAVPACLFTSAIVVILELGRGDAVPPVDSVVITHNYYIGSGIEDVANVYVKLLETAKERVAYDEAARLVMESRRLGTRSSSSHSMMQPKQEPCSSRPGVVDLENNGDPIAIASPAQIRYQSSQRPTSQYQQQPRVISIGPWGGRGGEPFRMNGTIVPRLRGITVYHSSASIHALTCEYSLPGDEGDADKRIRTAGPWGLPRFFEFFSSRTRDRILLSLGEYLTAVEGTAGDSGDGGGDVVVTSLTFRTSRGKTYGPYGRSGTGTPFSVPAASGCIVGLWGRSGRLLDAIGVDIKPCPPMAYRYPYPHPETWDVPSHGVVQ